MVPRETGNNAYAKFWRANKEYYGFFRLWLIGLPMTSLAVMLVYNAIDLIHDGRHVGFAIIMQISCYTLPRGQTAQVREVIMNILATHMICFTFIECLSPK